MLLKFFTNSTASSYLRELAEEFDESTNSIRHELNNLSKAGYLLSEEDGRTIKYRANTKHPLFEEVQKLVHKFLGIDKIINHILSRIGELDKAFIVGDYAIGKDSGLIELILVGQVNEKYVKRLVGKVEDLLERTIEFKIWSPDYFNAQKEMLGRALLIWGELD